MRRVFVTIELTDGQYDVLQKISMLEKQDHSEYAQDCILQMLESDIDHYYSTFHPERLELVDKLGIEAARKRRLAERKMAQE